MAGPVYGVAISEEILGEQAPVLFQGGILAGMQQAAELGFDTVELHIRNPHELDAAAIRAHGEAVGVRVAALGTGLENSRNGYCLTSTDAACRRDARDALKRHIEFAREFDAVVFLGLIRGSCGTYAELPAMLDDLATELLPIAEFAEQAGVRTGFEPVAYYFSDLLNTTHETVEYLSRPGLESIGLMLDTHHIFIEDPDMRAAILEAGPRITHVQMSDSNRRYPGAGNIDYEVVMAALQEIGFEGSMALEVLPIPSGIEAARLGLNELRRSWQAALDRTAVTN